jgi:hypothetical protein
MTTTELLHFRTRTELKEFLASKPDNIKILTHTISPVTNANYIIVEINKESKQSQVINQENETIKQLIKEWISKKVEFNSGVYETTCAILESFNEYSNMNLSARKLLPLFFYVAEEKGYNVYRKKARVYGKLQYIY